MTGFVILDHGRVIHEESGFDPDNLELPEAVCEWIGEQEGDVSNLAIKFFVCGKEEGGCCLADFL